EEIGFDTVTTGAANDIEKATNIAKAMVTEYGMSKKCGLIGLASMQNKYLDSAATLNCSDATAAEIDAEVVAILKESYNKALELLRENRELMDKLAEYLIEKETITGKEFMEIFRREKGLPEPKKESKEGSDAGTQAESSASTMDVIITDETAHSQDGHTIKVPEIILPDAPTIPGEKNSSESKSEQPDDQPPAEEPEAGISRNTDEPWRSQQPPTESKGRFSGGTIE
ncbi:MAG: ATP-dependent metallopeptidase HflB, partial [Acetatifactor sp.]|nr:ATP-dependent metallopeptidase HflB [Acetatifactor sp.]